MDQQYEEAVRTTEELHNKARDLIDDSGNSMGRQLLENAHRLYNDTKGQKNPRSLEDQTDSIMELLRQIRSSSEPAMSPPDADFLYKSYEQLKMAYRKFENH